MQASRFGVRWLPFVSSPSKQIDRSSNINKPSHKNCFWRGKGGGFWGIAYTHSCHLIHRILLRVGGLSQEERECLLVCLRLTEAILFRLCFQLVRATLSIFWLVAKRGRYSLNQAHTTEYLLLLMIFHSWTLRNTFFSMNNPCKEDQDENTVVGFEVPRSPDSSYNSVYPGTEDEARDPPIVPAHLQHTLLSYPPQRDNDVTLPLPQNVTLNHLYIENRETPRSVVALGLTHRFHSKFVTVVLYKPVPRRGNTSSWDVLKYRRVWSLH